MRVPVAVVAIASLVAVLACRDSAGPRTPGSEAGLYLARSLDGRPFPALIDSGPAGFEVMDADTLILDGLGGAVRASASHSGSATYGTSSNHFHTTAEYRMHGDSIEVGYFRPCPLGADCVPNEKGAFRGATLTLGRFYSYHEEFVRVLTPGAD